MPDRPLRIATRGSALARWQAEEVAARLRAAHPGLVADLVVISTSGDQRQDVPIWALGGQGVFVKEVQVALLDGRADLAVHSAKDLPSTTGPGLRLAALPLRADPRDALVGAPLAALPAGATVATGSVRRRAQLGAARPDLDFVGVRGSVPTRLGRVPDGGALVVAAAALDRLGLGARAAERLSPDVVLPQVGQGALAVECRDGDDDVASVLAAIDDPDVRATVEAERAFLATLGSGCDLPVGAWSTIDRSGGAPMVEIRGVIASPDGRDLRRGVRLGPLDQAADLAVELAGSLVDDGGDRLLAALRP